MASIVLTWTPSTASTVTLQTIEYKLSSSQTWLTHSNIPAMQSMATINGLTGQTSYDFRIIAMCNSTQQASAPITVTTKASIGVTISASIEGANMRFMSQYPVNTNLTITYDWVSSDQTSGTGLQTVIPSGSNLKVVPYTGTGTLTSVTITAVSPTTDGTVDYIF